VKNSKYIVYLLLLIMEIGAQTTSEQNILYRASIN